MLLCNEKDLFKNIIEEIGRKTRIQTRFIEKDFYAITILKELIKRDEHLVFKGGTSLSVCQHAINRFSEDIDISYEFDTITVGQKKKIKQSFIDSIEASSLTLSNFENIRSRRVFNRYICPYNTIENGTDTVIVEWAIITPSFPIEVKTAQTIIGKYLEQNGRHDLVEEYDLQSFEVKTITKERTFVDKVFAICDYHFSKKITRQSRHIYDIHQLLNYIKLDNNLADLFIKVKGYRTNLESCYSAKDNIKLYETIDKLIEDNTYLSDYNELTYPLLYDHIKYDECIKALLKVRDFLKNNDL